MTDIFNSRYYEFLRKVIVEEPECMLNPDIFFPEDWGDEGAKVGRLAKTLCYECPLMRDCAKYALQNKEEFGVWGGLTALERKKLRR